MQGVLFRKLEANFQYNNLLINSLTNPQVSLEDPKFKTRLWNIFLRNIYITTHYLEIQDLKIIGYWLRIMLLLSKRICSKIKDHHHNMHITLSNVKKGEFFSLISSTAWYTFQWFSIQHATRDVYTYLLFIRTSKDLREPSNACS